nr:hypothetical protein [Treponema sp.]
MYKLKLLPATIKYFLKCDFWNYKINLVDESKIAGRYTKGKKTIAVFCYFGYFTIFFWHKTCV